MIFRGFQGTKTAIRSRRICYPLCEAKKKKLGLMHLLQKHVKLNVMPENLVVMPGLLFKVQLKRTGKTMLGTMTKIVIWNLEDFAWISCLQDVEIPEPFLESIVLILQVKSCFRIWRFNVGHQIMSFLIFVQLLVPLPMELYLHLHQ